MVAQPETPGSHTLNGVRVGRVPVQADLNVQAIAGGVASLPHDSDRLSLVEGEPLVV